MFTTQVIEFMFSFALFINALLFIPQAIKIFREKTAKSVSLLTFLGFFLIQLATVLHGIINHDYILVIGYVLSMMTCGLVVTLIGLYSKRNAAIDKTDITVEEIIEQLPGHVYWKDINGIYLGTNANNWKDFGLESFSAVKGKTDFELFSESEAKALRETDEYVIQTGRLKIVEEIGTGKNKPTLIYLSYKVPLKNKQGQIVGILGNSLDITESKYETLNKLNMLENIIAVMPANIYWMNTEGVYLGCNDNQVKAIGAFSKEQIVGKRNEQLRGFLIPEFLDKVNRQVMEFGKEIIIEEPATLQDGTTGVFLSSKVPLRNLEGKIIGMVGVSIDITERKRAQEKLEMANRLIQEVSQTKTEFLANMRHDLRTPFNGILGLAEWMGNNETDPEKKENLSCIAQSARGLLSQLDEIFEFLDIENGQLPIVEKPFDLNRLIEDVRRIVLPSIKDKQLDFKVFMDDKLPQNVVGDRVRTQRILLNLITNAIRFTQKGYVNVKVTAQHETDQKVVVVFTIEDSGIGIPLDKQALIFERFNRLTQAHSGVYPGKGLGLSIVKKFLDDLNGQSHLQSEVDKGTRVEIMIPYPLPLLNMAESTIDSEPLAPEKPHSAEYPSAKPVSQDNASDPVGSDRKHRILLVEDDAIAAKVEKNVLSQCDCDVDWAQNGKAALGLVENHHYDLIFMDIGLPDINGYEVTQRIRSNRLDSVRHIPVVALSAHAHKDNQQFVLDAQINLMLSKPLTLLQAKDALHLFIAGQQDSPVVSIPSPVTEQKTTTSEEKVIDFDYAKKLLGNNDAVLKEMLVMLAESFPEEIAALQNTYQCKNWEALRAIVHKLKGGASYCGTLRLKSACAELENYIESGLTARIAELYDRLLAEINAVKNLIDRGEFVS